VNLPLVLTVFAVIFLAELPDKSLFASLVLSTRYRPLYVWLGVTAAFAVHVVVAVTAGGFLSLLPRTVVETIVAILFAVGAAYLLFGSEDAEEEAGEGVAEAAVGGPSMRKVIVTSFTVVFIGEWGDITQIATANFAAKYADPVSVGVGALLGLSAVAGVAVVAGKGLLRVVPVTVVRRVAGVILAGLAVATVVSLVRG
jgi:Ca2+/H+ antiporter, TMEM165/GDT1 family